MPKKFQGQNTKASSAKERKATKAAEEKEQRDKAAEDALWKDDDKQVAKKNMRKEERENKRTEEQNRKLENKLLAEEEEKEMMLSTAAKASVTKMTLFQVQQERRKKQAAEGITEVSTHLDAPLMENLNRMEDIVSGTGVDEAISALSTGEPEEGGGKGRVNMAAAFRAFEERRLPSIKKENPSLKFSQLKQMIRKEWQKSPENPLNKQQL